MSNLQTNVPLVNVPFVDRNGNVTEAWFLFLVQLWRRTGGNMPNPGNLTLADVISLEQTFPVLTQDQEKIVSETLFVVGGPEEKADVIAPVTVQEILDQTFSSGTDFTPGTTTTLTLSTCFWDTARLWIFFDAAFQGDDQYTLSGTTLAFTSAIPVGTNKVYVKGLM